MSLFEASTFPDGHRIDTEICIGGGGTAGLVLAAALRRAGYSVCVIESGLQRPDATIQSLDAIDVAETPLRADVIHRLRMVGGSSNLWSGRCVRLDEDDVARRPWVADSGWPISHAEYLRYTLEAATLLQLPRDVRPEAEPTRCAVRDGLATPDLRSTMAYWARSPARLWSLLGPELRGCRRTTIILGLTVVGLRFTPDGSAVHALQARDTVGRTIDVHARRFVLALGGYENTRLLLLACRAQPHAAVSRPALGRYVMDHPRAVWGRVRLRRGVDWRALVGRHPVSDGIRQPLLRLTAAAQQRLGVLNAYLHLEPGDAPWGRHGGARAMERLKDVLRRGALGGGLDLSHAPDLRGMMRPRTPEESMPFALFRAGHELRRIATPRPRDVILVHQCEQAPTPDRRIELSNRHDRFGNPLPRLHWRVGDDERRAVTALLTRFTQVLSARGLGELLGPPEAVAGADFREAAHHMGGTRMGTDPLRSVVDADLRVHGVRNLYVCGGSVFPTGGVANPAWSILALTLRLADHLTGQARGTKA